MESPKNDRPKSAPWGIDDYNLASTLLPQVVKDLR